MGQSIFLPIRPSDQSPSANCLLPYTLSLALPISFTSPGNHPEPMRRGLCWQFFLGQAQKELNFPRKDHIPYGLAGGGEIHSKTFAHAPFQNFQSLWVRHANSQMCHLFFIQNISLAHSFYSPRQLLHTFSTHPFSAQLLFPSSSLYADDLTFQFREKVETIRKNFSQDSTTTLTNLHTHTHRQCL